MARIALSVSSDYLPNWNVYEGLRELVQNYIDAQDDCGRKGEITYEGGTARGRLFQHPVACSRDEVPRKGGAEKSPRCAGFSNMASPRGFEPLSPP